MKKILLSLLLLVAVTSLLAQKYQTEIHTYLNQQDIDSLNQVIYEIEKHNPQSKNRYLSYWQAYAIFNKALVLAAAKEKKKAEKENKKALDILEKIENKTSEDYALLAVCYNYSISFASFIKVPSLSSKTKDIANKAIGMDDKNLRAYLVMGINDFFTPKIFGGQKQCEAYFLSAISLADKNSENEYDPSWGKSDAYYYLIRYYLSKNDEVNAIKRMKEALKLYPDNNRLKTLVK